MICQQCENLNKKKTCNGFYLCKAGNISLMKIKGNSKKYNWTYCSQYKRILVQQEFKFE